MKCPKCRCEVGNQSVCPYCGSTVYINGNSWGNTDYSHRPPVQMSKHNNKVNANNGTDVEYRLRALETRVNMIMAIQCGVFIIDILIMVILALK